MAEVAGRGEAREAMQREKGDGGRAAGGERDGKARVVS